MKIVFWFLSTWIAAFSLPHLQDSMEVPSIQSRRNEKREGKQPGADLFLLSIWFCYSLNFSYFSCDSIYKSEDMRQGRNEALLNVIYTTYMKSWFFEDEKIKMFKERQKKKKLKHFNSVNPFETWTAQQKINN